MTGVIATIPKYQFSSNGIPMVGGTLTTYITGTSTPSTTWADFAQTTANANPITLDSRGECVLFLDGSVSYRFVLKNSSGVTQWTQDNVGGAGGSQSYLTSVSGTNSITASLAGVSAYTAGLMVTFTAAGSNTGAVTLNINSLGVANLVRADGVALVTGDLLSGGTYEAIYDGTSFKLQGSVSSSQIQSTQSITVRQTVLSGAVDSTGYSAFGGSTGSTTVTTSTTIVATAANGITNRTGTIVNPSWTGLSTNGTMYLGLTINADGTCTPFSTTLAPTYQWGGTFATASGQRTFNIQAMQMQVGNGSTAAQAYDVFVGEVTVAGGVTTVITWYALMGRYDSGWFSVGVNTTYTKNHNLGLNGKYTSVVTIADDAAGTNDRILANNFAGGNGYWQRASTTPRNQIDVVTAGSNVGYSTSGTLTSIATAFYRILCVRSF